jgi:hypothetical protein
VATVHSIRCVKNLCLAHLLAPRRFATASACKQIIYRMLCCIQVN